MIKKSQFSQKKTKITKILTGKKDTILVLGSSGQLGNEIKNICHEYPHYNFIFKGRTCLDISDYNLLNEFLNKNEINTIINCAAYTDVDGAENDYEMANLINNISVDFISQCCVKHRIKLIHLSTDFVFDGNSNKPYIESDLTNPINNYGKTKLLGEEKIKKNMTANAVIIRTSWLYSKFNSNFVKKILDISKNQNAIEVNSKETGSPTWARDLAKALIDIIKKVSFEKVETYHYANSGYCTRYDFAKNILKIFGLKTVIKKKENTFNNIRPVYSVLNCQKIVRDLDIKLINWNKSLKQAIKEF